MNKKSELLPPLFIDIDETAELLRIVYKFINEEKLKASTSVYRSTVRRPNLVGLCG